MTDKQPETFKQTDMLYTHLLIGNAINNGYKPRTHLGCDEKSIVERAYDEGETSSQIFTWHSDEKFKRLQEANQEMRKTTNALLEWLDACGIVGDHLDKARDAIAKVGAA